MKKDSLICFRLSRDLRDAVIKVAKERRQSLSSTMEIALINYLNEREAMKDIENDRRQYPRKPLSIPAFINHYSSENSQLNEASVLDISLGGIKISIPGNMKYEISFDPQKSKFQIIFTLPNEKRPLLLACEPRNVVDLPENVFIGASIIDADFDIYKSLQAYLM